MGSEDEQDHEADTCRRDGCPLGDRGTCEVGDTLKEVQARGTLNCPGAIGSYLGFAEVDDKGNWNGLDIELCRAIATAIFGDPSKANIVPIDWAQRWPALQSGDIDIVIKASGGTLSRDGELGLRFEQLLPRHHQDHGAQGTGADLAEGCRRRIGLPAGRDYNRATGLVLSAAPRHHDGNRPDPEG